MELPFEILSNQITLKKKNKNWVKPLEEKEKKKAGNFRQ